MSRIILPLCFYLHRTILSGMKSSEASKIARLLGSLGGKARAKKLTAEQRQDIARKAVQARWAKKKGKGASP